MIPPLTSIGNTGCHSSVVITGTLGVTGHFVVDVLASVDGSYQSWWWFLATSSIAAGRRRQFLDLFLGSCIVTRRVDGKHGGPNDGSRIVLLGHFLDTKASRIGGQVNLLVRVLLGVLSGISPQRRGGAVLFRVLVQASQNHRIIRLELAPRQHLQVFLPAAAVHKGMIQEGRELDKGGGGGGFASGISIVRRRLSEGILHYRNGRNAGHCRGFVHKIVAVLTQERIDQLSGVRIANDQNALGRATRARRWWNDRRPFAPLG